MRNGASGWRYGLAGMDKKEKLEDKKRRLHPLTESVSKRRCISYEDFSCTRGVSQRIGQCREWTHGNSFSIDIWACYFDEVS